MHLKISASINPRRSSGLSLSGCSDAPGSRLSPDGSSSSSSSSSSMAFDGTWKVDKSDNYDKFMEVMGINIMKRKLAAHDNLKIIIEQTGDKFTIKESSTFRTVEIVFTLGVEFEYSMADGTELIGSWNIEAANLVGHFNRKDNGKELKTRRELIGDELHQTYLYEGVEAKRIFKRG